MYFLLVFISSLDFKPLFVAIEANLESVHWLLQELLSANSFTYSYNYTFEINQRNHPYKEINVYSIRSCKYQKKIKQSTNTATNIII